MLCYWHGFQFCCDTDRWERQCDNTSMLLKLTKGRRDEGRREGVRDEGWREGSSSSSSRAREGGPVDMKWGGQAGGEAWQGKGEGRIKRGETGKRGATLT